AEADKIPVRRPEDSEDHRLPLLPVQPADLGSQVWRLDFSNEPALLINKGVGDWRAGARSPVVRSLLWSAASPEVLTPIPFMDDYPDLDDRDEWRTRWLLFASSNPGVGDPPAEDARDLFEDWIESAVEAFAKRQQLFNHFLAFWQAEGSS